MPTTRHHARRTLFAWLRIFGVVVLALVAVESFVVMGILRPVVLHGSSMAPALLGPHVEATCPHCEWQFAVAADQLPPRGRYWCPDCLREFTPEAELKPQPGERVWVNRLRSPERWDVVVFRCPTQPTETCVKRVVALPGEQVDFRQGDLLVDGQLLRKSLAAQRRVRQLVHLEREAYRRWAADTTDWEWVADHWQHTQAAEGRLNYSPADRLADFDDLGVNQTATVPRHVAVDLMVATRVQVGRTAKSQFEASFAGERSFTSPPVPPGESLVEWSLFDQQAVLAVDGRVVWRQASDAPWPGPPRLGILTAGDVQLRDLRVYRDAYYFTRPVDRWPAAGVQLGPAEVFVVGDNVAISEDSRTWAQHGLPQKQLIGVPIGVK